MPPLGAEHPRPTVPEKKPEEIEIENQIDRYQQYIAETAPTLLPEVTKSRMFRSKVDTVTSPKATYVFKAQQDSTDSNSHQELTRAWLEGMDFFGVRQIALHTDRVIFDPNNPNDVQAVPEEGSSQQFIIDEEEGVVGLDEFELHERLQLAHNIAETIGMIHQASVDQAVDRAIQSA